MSRIIYLTGHSSLLGKEIRKLPHEFILSPRLEAITEVKADVVLHLAAVVHGTKEQYWKVNIEGTKQLVSACKKVKRFIFASTIALGQQCGDYGHSKLIGEQIIMASGIPYTILRFGQIIGTGFLERYHKLIIAPYIKGVLFHPVSMEKVVEEIKKSIEEREREWKIITVAGDPIEMKKFAAGFTFPIPLWTTKFIPGLSYDQTRRLMCDKTLQK